MYSFLAPLLLVRSRLHLSTRAVASGQLACACSCRASAAVTTATKIVHSPKKAASTANIPHHIEPFGAVPVVISSSCEISIHGTCSFQPRANLLDLTTPINHLLIPRGYCGLR